MPLKGKRGKKKRDILPSRADTQDVTRVSPGEHAVGGRTLRKKERGRMKKRKMRSVWEEGRERLAREVT